MVCIGEKAVVAGPMVEDGVSECAPSLQRYVGGTVALARSSTLWGQHLVLMGHYVLGVSLVSGTLTSTNPGKEKRDELYWCVRRKSCSICGFGGRCLSKPILMRKV